MRCIGAVRSDIHAPVHRNRRVIFFKGDEYGENNACHIGRGHGQPLRRPEADRAGRSGRTYRTETDTWTDEDGNTHTDTYEVPYEYYILHVQLQNKTLPAVVDSLLDAEQKEIYGITLELKGNKPYLWDDIYTSGGGSYDPGSDYTIPGEALSDPAFAALISEAEKYLGWPYVWGGSSPSTSFDCSGFVCWVYTASGVHNLPRTTATGIFNQCSYVSPADAKPGDLIFFTKTYACDGPVSHVGIYVGGGMMIHAGDPIKYASINTSYWQEHFYAFGRLN